MTEYTLIKIDQLPDGTANLSSKVMFGIGDKIHTTTVAQMLSLFQENNSITPRQQFVNLLVTNTNFGTILNGVNLTIAQNEIVFLRFNTLFNNRLVSGTYLVPLGAGVYNPLGSFVPFASLILINEKSAEAESETNTITYTVAGLDEINEAVIPFDFSDETKVYFVTFDSVLYRFIGVSGLYGDGELQMIQADLEQISNAGSGDFVEKQFYAIKTITTETFTLTEDGSTTFLLNTPTFGGFNFDVLSAVKLFSGKTFTLTNDTDEPITLPQEFEDATIKFTEEIVIPPRTSLRFYYNRVTFSQFRLYLIGAVGGDFIPLSGTAEGSPVTGDIVMTYSFEPTGNYGRVTVIEDIIALEFNGNRVSPIGFIFADESGVFANIINGIFSNTNYSEVDPTNLNIYAQRQYVVDKINEAIIGGSTSFLSLTDTPISYVGQAGKVVAVKSGEDGLEFVTGGGGTTIHNELTERNAADAHPISAITGLSSILSGKLNISNNIAFETIDDPSEEYRPTFFSRLGAVFKSLKLKWNENTGEMQIGIGSTTASQKVLPTVTSGNAFTQVNSTHDVAYEYKDENSDTFFNIGRNGVRRVFRVFNAFRQFKGSNFVDTEFISQNAPATVGNTILSTISLPTDSVVTIDVLNLNTLDTGNNSIRGSAQFTVKNIGGTLTNISETSLSYDSQFSEITGNAVTSSDTRIDVTISGTDVQLVFVNVATARLTAVQCEVKYNVTLKPE